MPERHELINERTASVVATGLAMTPVAVAGVRAAASSWVPIGDDAYFTIRSMDVATSHHPLVGAWSSGSLDISRQVNNLGPIQFDLLAPFTKVAPMGGTAIGVVTVHLAAIATIAWLMHRIGGYRAVVPAMAAVALLTWVLGSEMLIAARQHQFLVLPYLCVLVAAWAATSGDRWAPVPFVAAGSLVTQTHLSYPIQVAALCVPVIIGQVLAARARGTREEFRVPWITAAVIGTLLWLQTAVDQVAGWGNLGAALSSSGEADNAGLRTGLRAVAHVVVAIRGYVRPGFGEYSPDRGVAGDLRTAAFVLFVAAVAVATLMAIRTDHRIAAAGLGVALTAMCAGVMNAASLPLTQFGSTGLTSANHRWLWSITTFLVLGAFVAVTHYATVRSPRRPPVAIVLAALVLVVLVAANLPSSQQVLRPDLYRRQLNDTADLTRQLESVELTGPVLIDQSHLEFGHPFGYPVAVVLLDRGIAFRFEGAMQARRFGESRVADGTEPERLVMWHGQEALDRLDAPNRVAYVRGPDPLVVVLEHGGSS